METDFLGFGFNFYCTPPPCLLVDTHEHDDLPDLGRCLHLFPVLSPSYLDN
jgi:hypothetical protein